MYASPPLFFPSLISLQARIDDRVIVRRSPYRFTRLLPVLIFDVYSAAIVSTVCRDDSSPLRRSLYHETLCTYIEIFPRFYFYRIVALFRVVLSPLFSLSIFLPLSPRPLSIF